MPGSLVIAAKGWLCWLLMAKRPRPIDDVEFDTRVPVFGHPAKVIIGVVVFALGVLAGAGLAAWVVPPS
jgi:hypothetical protein